jgi:outer membrane receptor for ferrienterochelin and colicin
MIGYGQTTKRFNTGNVTTIRSDEIRRQPVNNVLAALQGLVPGLVVTQQTGLTGGAFEVVMRGNSTLMARGDPLVLIDGVPFPLDAFRTPNVFKFKNASAKAGGNPLNLLISGI